jgi:cytochrome c peroxidase
LESRAGLAWIPALLVAAGGLACSSGEEVAPAEPPVPVEAEADAAPPESDVAQLVSQAGTIFGVLPESVPNPDNPISREKIDLGRMLYYDARLSKNHDISCNSCHQLDRFGVDGEPTSPGHRGQRGDRNSPTVYNAALHVAQFWDGREPDVEAQAKGPVLNPIEMAAPSAEAVVAVLNSIPGYVTAFGEAFPDDADPVSYDNMARAIGAFERRLTTPGRFDRFLAGDVDALSKDEQRGLQTFIGKGCVSCHMGPAVGGTLYRKIGFVIPYETEDPGRENVTGEESDRHVFKVPSLRNVARTGPWFHDGSIGRLSEAVRLMGHHQLGVELDYKEVADIVAFLNSLTGVVDKAYVAKPSLPESGHDTPAPDPT